MTNEKTRRILLDIADQMPSDECADWIDAISSGIKAIDAQPCEDCISRKAVDKIINKWLSHPDYELKDNIYDMTKKIHKLPSVTPQRPKGKWIFREDMGHQYCCSECGCPKPSVNDYYYKKIIGCPYCLADMSGGGEDEDGKSL